MSDSSIVGPVRKIGYTRRSISGVFPKFGHYESALERDMMALLSFNPAVARFVPQPVTIDFVDRAGEDRSFTPDGYVEFDASSNLCPLLYEVKYRSDFRKDWKILIQKFRAAKNYCLERYWRFDVFTEVEIRTVYLDNIKFLRRYLERPPEPETRLRILQILTDLSLMQSVSVDFLLHALCRSQKARGRMIPAIWHLLAVGDIGCDMDAKLTMRTPIWARTGE